ncbi:hypothetical protein LRR80_05921 [Streptomyces sp. RO-S4]|nr:hypothetical protein [Streptomyces sp. RO-S4]
MHQDLAAAGEADEDAADAAGQFGALHGGPQGGAVHGAEGLGDLSRLVLRGRSGRCLGVDVDLAAGAQRAHRLGKFAVGDVQGVVAQADQFDHQAASDADRDDQGGRGGEEAEEHGGAGRSDQPAFDGVGAVGDRRPRLTSDRPHVLPHPGVRAVPGALRHGLGRPHSRLGGEDLVLRRVEDGVGTAVGERAPRGADRSGQVGRGGGGERTAQFHGAGEQPQPLPREAAVQAGGGQDRVLLREGLLRPGELEQYARVGAEFGVLDAGEGTAHAEGRGDGAGVAVVRLRPSRASFTDRRAQGAQALGGGDEGVEPVGHGAGQCLAVGDGTVLTEPQGGHGPLGAPGEAGELRVADGRGVGGAADGCGPLRLEGGDGGGDRGADGGVGPLHLAQPGDVLGGGHGCVTPQGEQGDDRHHQQADDLGADGPGAVRSASGRHARRARFRRVRRAFLGRRSGVRAPAAYGRPGRRLGTGGRGPPGCAHGLLARKGGPDGWRAPRGHGQRAVGSTGRGAETGGWRSPAAGDSATKAEVMKR